MKFKCFLNFKLFAVSILLLFHTENAVVLAQTLNAKEQTFQDLSIFLEQRDNHDLGWIARSNNLKEKGIDVIRFSNQILEDDVFIDYRGSALYLLATQKYNTDPEYLTELIINDYKINQYKLLPGYLNSNVQCLNILKALTTPSFLENENIKESIVSFTDELLHNKSVFEPNFWIDKSNLTTLAALSNENITREQKDLLNTTDTKARLCLGLTAFVFYATENEIYFDVLSNALKSENQMIVHSAKYYLSDLAKQRWHEGRYELFAVERGIRQHSSPIIKSQEEIQSEIDSSLRARNRPPKN